MPDEYARINKGTVIRMLQTKVLTLAYKRLANAVFFQ
ncbi:hypothetical protein CCP2SC5_160010 [Azospirillaceae bacterium]